jgi:hypothetical protein
MPPHLQQQAAAEIKILKIPYTTTSPDPNGNRQGRLRMTAGATFGAYTALSGIASLVHAG